MSGNFNKNFNTYFSGGLGKGGQAAAWLLAIGVVGAWQYYESQKIVTLSDEERNKLSDSKGKSKK